MSFDLSCETAHIESPMLMLIKNSAKASLNHMMQARTIRRN